MAEHSKGRNAWNKRRGNQWRVAFVQTMFAGPRRRYFEVLSPEVRAQANREELGETIQRLLDEGRRLDREELKSASRASNEQLPTDNTPWTRKTR
ncbi:hypothetical protein LTR54_018058, partial [Friedmanniomyces endolithicus]